jgi:cell division protein FtsX
MKKYILLFATLLIPIMSYAHSFEQFALITASIAFFPSIIISIILLTKISKRITAKNKWKKFFVLLLIEIILICVLTIILGCLLGLLIYCFG